MEKKLTVREQHWKKREEKMRADGVPEAEIEARINKAKDIVAGKIEAEPVDLSLDRDAEPVNIKIEGLHIDLTPEQEKALIWLIENSEPCSDEEMADWKARQEIQIAKNKAKRS